MLRPMLQAAKMATYSSSSRLVPIFRPVLLRARFESTVPPPNSDDKAAWKAARERADDLIRDWDAKVITYEELKPKTESPSPDAYLIDVREPDEVAQGMIPSAVNIPLTVLGDALHMSPEDFSTKFGFRKPGIRQEVTFYCRSGKRSTSASDVAKRNGYTNILNFKGSWLDWVERETKK
ncbi:Rhodanese-like protein [Armillaria solidipes]|uniref:Rhodanese-like protein n=1 Tax=Armillaria solidipes TaxID=1076256 RepID=A0A2H3CJV4_9AGAR|nr:Rhodanese-like protein [Armillaria solidipes]